MAKDFPLLPSFPLSQFHSLLQSDLMLYRAVSSKLPRASCGGSGRSLSFLFLVASVTTQLDAEGGGKLGSVGTQCSYSKGTVHAWTGLLCCLVAFLPVYARGRNELLP